MRFYFCCEPNYNLYIISFLLFISFSLKLQLLESWECMKISNPAFCHVFAFPWVFSTENCGETSGCHLRDEKWNQLNFVCLFVLHFFGFLNTSGIIFGNYDSRFSMFRFGNAVILRAASPGLGVLEEAMCGFSPRTSSSTESQGVNSQCPS